MRCFTPVSAIPVSACICTLLSVEMGLLPPAMAQIAIDGSLPTTVTQSNLTTTTITNGAVAGTNLFHSFREFSIPTGSTATFDLTATPGVTTIFSRVTGGTASTLDGTLRTIGGASPSVFLLNPAGIILGPNARLDIGGSFVGTTAQSIQFGDRTEFSAVNPRPLLTLSVPVGLQFGANPRPIHAQGPGHAITQGMTGLTNLPTAVPFSVAPGHTLALMGGDITLDGTLLAASQIVLGSVASASTVPLQATAQGWQWGRMSGDLGTIELRRQALLNASGVLSGSIALQGGQITFQDGSAAVLRNQGLQAAGLIDVKATAAVTLQGTSRATLGSGLYSANLPGTGPVADIVITTPQFHIQNGGQVFSQTSSSAHGGNIRIQTTEQVRLSGQPPRFAVGNRIAALSSSSGPAGNIEIVTPHLRLLDGSSIMSSVIGVGAAGEVAITAETVTLAGFRPDILISSYIGSSASGPGNGRNLTITTRRLMVHDGGRIDASTYGQGNAGNVSITASEAIEVSGSVPIRGTGSQIGSAAELFDVQVGSLPRPAPTGNAGTLTLRTGELRVSDGGTVSVKNRGTGNGGSLDITAESVVLRNGGTLSASTASGEGGNIRLDVGHTLLLRSQGQITAEARGTGNGGNIAIAAPIIAGFENSDIIANAIRGRGGNIQINTQGIVGLQFRNQLTAESDITASSTFGINGTVQITTPTTTPDAGLIQLAQDTVDPTQQVAVGCSVPDQSSFVATGRGGVPLSPAQTWIGVRPWSDARALSGSSVPAVAPEPTVLQPAPLVEATAARRTPDGRIELYVASTPTPVQELSCAAVLRPTASFHP
jgi:filamentous hemagglutinin family protein